MTQPKYGRGKFDHHEGYVKYQKMIVAHPAYAGMPGAVSENGKPVWQVSSGKNTSFYKYFTARKEWWIKKADELGLTGEGDSNDRLTNAARQIHPTKYRHCLICGEERNIGYFYLNYRFTTDLNSAVGRELFSKGESISAALVKLAKVWPAEEIEKRMQGWFGSRKSYFDEHGVTADAFEASAHIRTGRLSPGFMGNPPYRLDGIHDYCSVTCRKKNDPGRSDANMRTYAHDRRAFQWWAEGNWALADAVYNKAGRGTCAICLKKVAKVSPDHVGPLACGFRQLSLFVPTCRGCNSSKNRRMRRQDVKLLVAHEQQTGTTVASWQVRPLWDRYKLKVATDGEAEELSAWLRALQDYSLRLLHRLMEAGHVRFLSAMLHPEHAYLTHTFSGFDPAKLTFTNVAASTTVTPNRQSLAARSVRIAFESLPDYAKKKIDGRRLRPLPATAWDLMEGILSDASNLPRNGLDEEWCKAISIGDVGQQELQIRSLLNRRRDRSEDRKLRERIDEILAQIAIAVELP
ncbi:hypothetical protein ACERK3_01485 [Phycisphaerales bacterium AB-hyl4]|uniref:HNH endonuclease n=1 Tax=Natronomicrosphaera hydrolytica TaxID=3242702 RepID=A0ABV4U036_9BACT